MAHAGQSQSTSQQQPTYFDKERDQLISSITNGFEELLSASNDANRKLEQALLMTKEYETVAALWTSFHNLMKGVSSSEDATEVNIETAGLPGTGGARVSTNTRP